jgi:hypothetical protein
MIDMSSLMEEMDSMPSFDAPRKVEANARSFAPGEKETSSRALRSDTSSLRHTESSSLKQREKEERAMKAAESITGKGNVRKKLKKKRIQQSKFHGDAPMDLMTEFLGLVSSNQIQAALDFCPKILKYEPDNILIKMYQETMEQAMEEAAQAKIANGGVEEVDSSSESEDESEPESESEAESDSGRDRESRSESKGTASGRASYGYDSPSDNGNWAEAKGDLTRSSGSDEKVRRK